MRNKKVRLLAIFVLCFVLSITIYYFFNEGIKPSLMAQGESLLRNQATGIMNNAVKEVLLEVGDTSELLRVEKDDSGRITMISTDTTKINEIANKCAILAREQFVELEETKIGIPLGNIVGSKLFSGKGPKVKIKVQPLGSATADFYTEFESAGINQTRYKIYVVLKANMQLVYGSATQSVTVETSVLISEAIIIGDVPDTFTDIGFSGDSYNLIP